ncbi:MAG: phosphate ABC transporter permease PstA [Cyanosarcina radialis HA8281-LM2]|jgi:phosphate transport system permease protein|nr:phosphate ABC transporter permease PstA [Cyanosarcina radialis HA8281-LM2]
MAKKKGVQKSEVRSQKSEVNFLPCSPASPASPSPHLPISPSPPPLSLLPTITVWAIALLVTATFAWIVGDIIWHGAGTISWEFLTTAPKNSGREGGIAPILVATGLILGVCLAVSLPLGIGTAILLAEFTPTDSWFGRLVRRSLDVLAGVPSIVFGLFGNVFFARTLGLGFSILSGGLTLACMVLPILIRSAEEGLRAVPNDYRLAAASLGLSRTTTLWQLLLPAAVPGLLVGLVLGIGRAMAETAALIFTSGYVDRMPQSLFDSGRALSIHIFDLSMNVSGGDTNAYGSALVLVVLLLLINGTAAQIADRWLHKF